LGVGRRKAKIENRKEKMGKEKGITQILRLCSGQVNVDCLGKKEKRGKEEREKAR
jgi:hypothetical protein